MKKLLAASLLALSTTAVASDVKWDSLELSKETIKLEGLDDFRGYSFKGTKNVDGLLLTVSKSEVKSDNRFNFYSNNFNVTAKVESISFGVGVVQEVSETADFFVSLNHIEIESSLSFLGYSVSEDEKGTALEMGVRSMFSDNLELNGSVSVIDSMENEPSINIGANYYLTDSFSIGLSASKSKGVSGSAVIAKMYF